MCVNKSRRRPDGCLLQNKRVCSASQYRDHRETHTEEHDICVGRKNRAKTGLKKVKEEEKSQGRDGNDGGAVPCF